MTLLWPSSAQQVDLSKAQIHAFIIGVGDYPHLSGGSSHPAVANFGLQQLTTTPVTARVVSKWFVNNRNTLALPLGSVEVLISPSQAIADEQGNPVPIDPATMKNIKDTFDSKWWPRCNSQLGNIALFYFAGHGLRPVSQLLLPSDFGNPQSPNLWDNCIAFDEMRVGMRANQADTQLFFIDACREKPIDALAQNNPSGDNLCSSSLFDQVAVSAAYFAAADGKLAYGPDDENTYFSQALIESLEGTGANNNGGTWVVDTFSLSNSLGKIMNMIAKNTGHPLTCNPDVDGQPRPICRTANGLVKASIGCTTQLANSEARIILQRNNVTLHSPAGERRPWIARIDAGEWDIDINFQTFPRVTFKDTLMPPIYDRLEAV